MFDIHSAAFCVIRGDPTPIDLCAIQNKKRKFFAFLSLTWGIISDIDIESERFRLLGNARFTAGAISRILALRIYGGKLSFLPSKAAGECPTSDDNSLERSGPDAVFQTTGIFNEELNYSKLKEDTTGVNFEEAINNHKQRAFSDCEAKSKSGKFVNTLKRMSLTNVPRSYEAVDEFPVCPTIQESNNQLNNSTSVKRAFSTSGFNNRGSASHASIHNGVVRSTERSVLGPADAKLSPLDQELSEQWVTVDGEFVTAMVLLISHLGSALFSCPGLGLGDGEMCLLFIRKGISRKSLIDILTKMETGDHVTNSDIELHKIQGFRLEPRFDRAGYIAVDGEAVEYEAVQGQVHKGLGRVFACS